MTKSLENLDEIRDVARVLLRKADAEDRLPTPVDDIVASCGLLESDDYVFSESKISQAPRELRKLLRSAGRKIRGALDRRERVLHVSPSIVVPAQKQFVRCHEAMHDALPWQRDLVVLGDTNRTLAPDVLNEAAHLFPPRRRHSSTPALDFSHSWSSSVNEIEI